MILASDAKKSRRFSLQLTAAASIIVTFAQGAGMQSESTFADLLARLRSRDSSAAGEVLQRYAQQLIRLASRRVVGALRRKVDAEDLVQSALGSFFRAEAETPFELHDWDNLWAVLATITLRKCGYQVRQFLTAKRNISLEGPLPATDDSGADWQGLAREATPAEAAVLSDLVEQLLKGLDGKTRQIAELMLEGHTAVDIAPLVALTERSVFRQMARIRARLEELYGKDVG
jgi:RNA polymerase sigma factor (sigma-70 family)